MEDKLVTLAILTYTKAQILKNVLENEGIETYIHNVNQIQPVVSSGVRLRIKESDLPRALKITESSTWLSESIVGEKEPKVKDKSNKILIPVDFSNYSMKHVNLHSTWQNRKCRSHPVACLFHAYLCIVVALWGCFQLPDWR